MPAYYYVESFFKILDHYRNWAVLLLIDNRFVEGLVKRHWLTPNGLTMFRLVVSVMIVSHFGIGYWVSQGLQFLEVTKWYIFALFLLGALSDAIDGPLARLYGSLLPQEDLRFGINFDRHVDKLFTGVLLAIYWLAYDLTTRWVVSVVIAGDVAATVLAVISVRLKSPIHSNAMGKAKMTMQCVGIGAVILRLHPIVIQYTLVAAFTLGVASLVTNIQRFRVSTTAD